MQIDVVTPEGHVLNGPCHSVTLHAHDGSMGILPGHAPMVAELGAGVLHVETDSKQVKEILLSGGYLQILKDSVTVLATESWELDKIDREDASGALDTALKMTASDDATRKAKEKAIARARALLAHA